MKKGNYITGIKVSLVVGTILNAINSYDVILNGRIDNEGLFKIILTYVVPFFVSIFSSWQANKTMKELSQKK